MFRPRTCVVHKPLFIPPSSRFMFSSYLSVLALRVEGREMVKKKTALTSEIKNPFTLLSHPFWSLAKGEAAVRLAIEERSTQTHTNTPTG